MTTSVDELYGLDVHAADGKLLGKVDDIYLDDVTARPTIARVKHGVTGRKAWLVPIMSATRQASGLVVPYAEATIEHAPLVEPRDHITAEQEAQLLDYYGIALESITRPPVAGSPGVAGSRGSRATRGCRSRPSTRRPPLPPAANAPPAIPRRPSRRPRRRGSARRGSARQGLGSTPSTSTEGHEHSSSARLAHVMANQFPLAHAAVRRRDSCHAGVSPQRTSASLAYSPPGLVVPKSSNCSSGVSEIPMVRASISYSTARGSARTGARGSSGSRGHRGGARSASA